MWDLVNSKLQYYLAVPILIDWLEHIDERVEKIDRDRLLEGIIRALSVPVAKPTAAPMLISLYSKEYEMGNKNLLWAIGNALSVVADDSSFLKLVEFARDRRYGTSRQMIVLGFGNSKRPEAIPLLVELLDDDEVNLQALTALSKLDPSNIRDLIGKLENHPNKVIQRALVKILSK